MNSKNVLYLLTVVIMLLSIDSYGQQMHTLTFRVTNLKSSKGRATINLFREHDDIPKRPFTTVSAAIQDGIAVIAFNDLESGEYAAIAYHDENSNGILDHKMGFPNEPMGFSNNWNLTLFSGMPTFRKLRFKFDGSSAVIEIPVD